MYLKIIDFSTFFTETVVEKLVDNVDNCCVKRGSILLFNNLCQPIHRKPLFFHRIHPSFYCGLTTKAPPFQVVLFHQLLSIPVPPG